MKPWLFLLVILFTACQQPSPVGTKAPSSPATPVEGAAVSGLSEAAVVEKFSLADLSAAEVLLRLKSEISREPEGEGAIGCRIEKEEAKASLAILSEVIDEKLKAERARYTENPFVYAREEGFERCASKCFCGTLSSLLKSVDAKSLQGPKTRSVYQTQSKRLSAKSHRQSDEERRACAENQTWYCASDLRDFVRTSKVSTAPVAAQQ